MSTKRKIISLIIGLMILAIALISFLVLLQKGRLPFGADVYQTITNQANVQYCKEGDNTQTCNPSSGKYSYSTQSNTVQTAIVSSGLLNFKGSINYRLNGCPILSGTITIKNANSNTVAVSSAPITLNADCTIGYKLTAPLTAGNYNVIFNIASLLNKTANNLSLPTENQINIGVFTSGDFYKNDCVKMEDWGRLAAHWGETPSSPNWNPQFDLKGDGLKIGMEDWGVMAASWGQGTGCQ